MSVVIVTGSAGLIGSEAVAYFAEAGHKIVGIDNNFRQRFFGPDASTEWNRLSLEARFPKQYTHVAADIRDSAAMDELFGRYGARIALVVHTAAQPSHDWAASDPLMDFTVNANGTLSVLEATRKHAPKAVFIFTSTNKVYGDAPNELPLRELETRWEIDPSHHYWEGIDEKLRIDQTKHSLFGASKVAADVLVYFGDLSGVFRHARHALRDGGLFGFSVEAGDAQDFALRSTLRYTHSAAYLRRLAHDQGFAVEAIESAVLRQEDGDDVVGHLVVLRCA